MRTITDIDVLAFRFPRGLTLANPRKRAPQGLNVSDIDPGLGVPVIHELLHSGASTLPSGVVVRLIAFGAFPPGAPVPPCRIISLGHVLEFLQSYVHRHWHVLRHLQFKDPAFGFLMTLEKARRGGAGRRGKSGVELVPSTEPRRRHDVTPRHVQRYGRGAESSA